MLVVGQEGFRYTRTVKQVYNELAIIGSFARNITFLALGLSLYIGGPIKDLNLAFGYAKL